MRFLQERAYFGGIASDVALSWQGFWGFWLGISLYVCGGMFRQAEFFAAKKILGVWQRARNEQKESKQELKDTQRAVQALLQQCDDIEPQWPLRALGRCVEHSTAWDSDKN
jgi:hypothetical protein